MFVFLIVISPDTTNHGLINSIETGPSGDELGFPGMIQSFAFMWSIQLGTGHGDNGWGMCAFSS